MRNFTKLVIASAMLATQATPTAPSVFAASVQTSVPTVVSSQSNIVFSTDLASAVELKSKPQPNFDSEVLAPLKAAQDLAAKKAAEAQAAAAEAARLAAIQAAQIVAAAKPVVTAVGATVAYAGPSVLSAAQIQFLGNCESGMTANRNSGNGFYGAFQFTISTWNAMGTGYARADLAPLDVQIAAVQQLLSRSSIFSQFPGCARKMQAAGLI